MNGHQPQQLYSYQGPLRKQHPNYVRGVNGNGYMYGPQVSGAGSYGNMPYPGQPAMVGENVTNGLRGTPVDPVQVKDPLAYQQNGGQQIPMTTTHPHSRTPISGGANPQSHIQPPQSQHPPQQPPTIATDGSKSASTVASPFATPSAPASATMAGVPGSSGIGLAPTPGFVTARASSMGPSAGTGIQVPSPLPGMVPTAASQPPRRVLLNGMMPYPMRKYLSNMAILRLHEILNLINVSTGRVDDFSYWQRFTHDLFTPYGIMRYSTKGGEETRQFEFTTPIIPLICQSLGAVGIVRLETVPQQLRAQVLSNGTIFFDCPRCTTTYHYPDGSYMTTFAQMKGLFDSNLKIEWLEIVSYSFVPGIEWNSIERLISTSTVFQDIVRSLNQKGPGQENDFDKSQKSVNGESKDEPMPLNFAAITKLRSQFRVFHNISSFGIQESFMRALQVNDVLSYLKNLKVYQKIHNIQSPLASLEALVASSRARNVQNVPNPTVDTSAPLNASNRASPFGTGNGRPQMKRTSSLGKPPPAKRRQSGLSPLSTGDKEVSLNLDSVDNTNNGPFKKVQF
ncbi:LAMI_0F14444g1_1 [Lachancea mirantina]|uniref:LAMI_0F14444g1_1 n=1 Tax=Lachancea mirantina TaxID=1230905 RepID=A0A1G4K3Z5_9SACH|nr:LAMI_0F14444g1_1 [Lachancea mirantina]